MSISSTDLLVAILLTGWLAPCTVKTIKFLEGGLRPDAEATDVSTRGYLQQVQARHIQQGDTYKQSAEISDRGKKTNSQK